MYDLEKFICHLEGKETFAELKLGPLQKFPLIYHYFKFPHDREIKKCTLSDVLKHLWQYCGKEGKGKKVELDKFLEYLTTKGGFNEPYEMGVQINSIALAISVSLYVFSFALLRDFISQVKTEVYIRGGG